VKIQLNNTQGYFHKPGVCYVGSLEIASTRLIPEGSLSDSGGHGQNNPNLPEELAQTEKETGTEK